MVPYISFLSNRCRPNLLSDWLLYSSALDVSQKIDDTSAAIRNPGAEWKSDIGHRNGRIGPARGQGSPSCLTMTLDRPKTAGPTATATGSNNTTPKASNKIDKYPPVLGYLATLTRTKAAQQQPKNRLSETANNNLQTPPSDATAAQQQHQSTAGRKLSNLFSKNANNSSGGPTNSAPPLQAVTAVKIKSKLIAAAPAIIKTAILRSRSKESVLDSSLTESSENLWQHKSSVPCFVGWRPPMPLPKDILPYQAPENNLITSNNINNSNRVHHQCKTVRVTRTESRRSNLSRRKFSSESDLLDAYESASGYYMAIDRYPPPVAMPLSLLSYQRRRSENAASYSTTVNQDELVSSFPSYPPIPHTLPRNKIQSETLHSSSTSLRVQFNLDGSSSKQTATAVGKDGDDDDGNDNEHWKKRLLLVENRFKSSDRLWDGASKQRCGPWNDYWTADPSVRLCEIAQL